MPEGLNLLPCPACGEAKFMALLGEVTTYVVCIKCGLKKGTVVCIDCDDPQLEILTRAATIWNALPRALTWTTEPPKVAGFYFAEQTMDDGSKEITPIEVFPQYHWRHTDWERRYGKLPCLLCLGGFGVGPISKYSRFAGPIPQPKEQTP